ncbi:MAG: AMP-binding protein, partial [Dermatophilaceae bacterium]|nr:AMP-binding protein [Dermatophilaceae bacterium]
MTDVLDTLDATLSHTRGETDPPLIEQTIGDNFDATVARFGDREALVDVTQGRRWTYAALQADVDRLARALLALGVTTGDRVGIWAPNCSEWTLVQYATAKIGAILVNINPSYRAHELQYVLGQAGISTLVAAESFKSSNYRQMVDEVREEVPGLGRVVYIGTSDWDELVARADEVSAEELARVQGRLKNTDPINIQYTSGTTGFPKGAT